MGAIIDVLNSRKREDAINETFGHLKADSSKEHNGYIVFTLGCHGDLVLINYDFEDVCSSPWLFEDAMDFISDTTKERGEVLKFIGTYCNRKFKGKVTKIKI